MSPAEGHIVLQLTSVLLTVT